MLFLGFGTGLGSALIVDGVVEPMELGHLPYKKRTYEDYVGRRGLEKFGKKKWRRYIADVVARFTAALQPDDVVLGGGNVGLLKELPPAAGPAITRTHSWVGFACGRSSLRPPSRPAESGKQPWSRERQLRRAPLRQRSSSLDSARTPDPGSPV